MAEWTQEQAIAYECARECITDMMSILTRKIEEEATKDTPTQHLIDDLRAQRSKFAAERAALHVHDNLEVSRIRTEYGAIIRMSRSARRAASAE